MSNTDLKKIIGSKDDLADRWLKRAQELRDKAASMTSETELAKELLILQAMTFEHCASDLKLYSHFERKLE